MDHIVWGRRCRRCKGNLAVESDPYGDYVSCIQCGAIEYELTKLIASNTPQPEIKDRKREAVGAKA